MNKELLHLELLYIWLFLFVKIYSLVWTDLPECIKDICFLLYLAGNIIRLICSQADFYS